MDFNFDPIQLEAVSQAREFAEARLAQRSSPSTFDREAFQACAQHGIFAAPFVEGERRHTALTSFMVFEALGRGGADRGLLFAMGAHLFGCALPLAKLGNDAQRQSWVSLFASGEALGALAITEPEVGSNPSRMHSVATPRGDGYYTLNGTKTLITNAVDADAFVVIAREGEASGALGLSAFLVPRSTPGIEVRPLSAIGLSGGPVGEVTFNNCELTPDAMIGRPRGGFPMLLAAMQYERTCLLAGFLGAAERDLYRCFDYTNARKTERGSVFQYQAVSHRLARLRCRLDAARLIGYRGAWAIDNQKDPFLKPAQTKLVLSETVVDAATDVLRTFAGAGWLNEGGVGQALSDVIGTLSASGTSDVQLDLIASRLTAKGGR